MLSLAGLSLVTVKSAEIYIVVHYLFSLMAACAAASLAIGTR